MAKPSIGRIVHYVSHDSPSGESGTCQAAIVTEVPRYLSAEPDGNWDVSLAVLSSTGTSYYTEVPHNSGTATQGEPGCPNAASHGRPFRYCACGWTEAHPISGTWHWPEREED
jgi:hypothetical protein